MGDVVCRHRAAHVTVKNSTALKGSMDALFDLFVMLAFHWRIGITVLAALATALFLATTVSWFTGWYGICW